MDFKRKFKVYVFPTLFLILPAVAGIFWEFFNRYYRGQTTPFLYPALGLLLLSLFFWVKRKWIYILLLAGTAVFLFFFFRHLLDRNSYPHSVVYYYRHWSLDTRTGKIKLSDPIGPYPPAIGAYVSCNFTLKNWQDFLNTQPLLCTGFDKNHRLKMVLNDSDGLQGPVREFQVNFFFVDRKSLMGEPLDRWALRIAFKPNHQGISPHYGIQAIYEVYEREIRPGQSKIVESFSRNPDGSLKNFTESPLIKFSQKDVYALYGPDGGLIEIPRMNRRSFSFPAKIDVQRYENYELPRYLSSLN